MDILELLHYTFFQHALLGSLFASIACGNCQNAVNQANAAVDVVVLLSSGKSIKDYAGTSDTGYQVWVDFEKVDAANVDKYIK